MALGSYKPALICCLLLLARVQWAVAAADNAAAAQAALEMGLKYDLGDGVPADQVEAYHWYLLAAKAGVPEAEFNVAVMNDSGIGTKTDRAAAATWYARAAAHGYQRAAYNLAELYKTGQGVPQNPDAAAAWLQVLGQRAERVRGAGAGTGPLQPAVLVAPANGDGLRASRSRAQPVEFVWTAPAQPAPVRFFLEVVSLDNNIVQDVFAQYVDQTAALVTLPDKSAGYEWRVCAVSDTDYSVSTWNFFYQE